MDQPLTGVFAAPKTPELSIKNICNGTFQEDYEKYFNYNLAGRPSMTRINNQIMYSLFRSANNREVLIGKDNYLYDPQYITSCLDEPDETEAENLLKNMLSLALLQKKFEEI
jgi:hypothetical protein